MAVVSFLQVTSTKATICTQSWHSAHSGPFPVGGISHWDPFGHNRGWFMGEVQQTIIPHQENKEKTYLTWLSYCLNAISTLSANQGDLSGKLSKNDLA